MARDRSDVSRRPSLSAGLRSVRTASGYGALWLWTLLCLAPIFLVVLSSLKTNTEIFASQLALPTSVQFSNFTTAWTGTSTGESLPTYMLNSIIVAGVALTLGVGSGTMAGYALARWRSKLAEATYLWLLIMLTVPLLVTMIPIFGLANTFGLRNNLLGLGLVYAAFIVPFAAVVMRSFFQDFPKELVEATRLDGASEWRSFRSVVLPLSLGPIAGISMLALIWIWAELLFAIVLVTKPEMKTLPVGLLGFRGQYYTDLGVLFAGLVIATGPIILAYLVFQRKVTKGITFGAFR
jgi:raffinose/stachyose/melibiose transport system permease protein